MKAKNFFSRLWIMLKSNWAIKLLALLFAFIIWSYVLSGSNPTRTMAVDDVSLAVTNTAELRAKDLIVDEVSSEIPETVTVTVEAGMDSHKSITADTLRPYINLSDIQKSGKVTARLYCTSTISGVTIKSISPAEITLDVDELTSKNIPVVARLQGDSRSDYYVSQPKLDSDNVTISGAKTAIERVSKAVCYVNIEDLTANIRESYPLTLYDSENNEIPSSVVISSIPSAIVDIKVLPKKTVPIDEQSVLDAITNIKDGYEVTGIQIQPKTVQIAAAESVLEGIESVRVQSINADGADKSITFDAAIQPLENVEYLSASMVEVRVDISEIRDTRTFRNRRIEIQNLEEGLGMQITSERYTDVTVEGGVSVLKGLSADDFKPYIDLAGLDKGTHVCKVEIPDVDGVSADNITMSVSEVTVVIK